MKLQIAPRVFVLLADLIIVILSFFLSYLSSRSFDISQLVFLDLLPKILLVASISSFSFILFGTYSGIVRYTGYKDGLRLLKSVSFILSILLLITIFNFTSLEFRFTTLLFFYLISFAFLIGYRLLFKSIYSSYYSSFYPKKNIVIYGAGEAGFAARRIMEHDPTTRVKVVAYIDDNPQKSNKVVDGVKIYPFEKLGGIFDYYNISEIVIASFSIAPARRSQLVEACMERSITVLNVPPLEKWINGQFTKKQLNTIRIEQLLERDPIKLNHLELGRQLIGGRVIVTGGAGSIGSEIIRQLLKYHPATIVVVDQAETPLHDLELELASYKTGTKLVFFLGDVRNANRMEELFSNFHPQFVYHAAAYKHVPMMELSPSEAILTNVAGTKLIADLAVKYKVRRFVMISTDKAVNPTNVMGASKRLAEMYVQELSNSSSHQTKFITTRFGNVLGSNGSVVLRFKNQIAEGGPVTVTHPDIIRYFMTIPEASQLVLEAGSMGNGGEIFVFDMGKPIPIVDLARKMIRLSGFTPDSEIAIMYTGLRPGEKLYEELLNDAENTLPTHHEKILIAKVREFSNKFLSLELPELFHLASSPENKMAMVAKMKELIPEFVSNNSVFQKLDGNIETPGSLVKAV
jgi:FlaA1/EpsC-like NDP-sugar epimerase